MEKVVVIVGPTGIGKTDISLGIARYFNTDIINADASQIKKELNIGTAKIDTTKTSIKHYLIDFLNPEDNFSIYDYQCKVRSIINSMHKENKLPILVGGSGLYINSTIYDYDLTSDKHSLDFEKKYQSLTNEELHEQLKMIDYEAYQAIPMNNRRRVIRAIEIGINGNKSISENKNGNKFIYDSIIICLNTNRDILYDRINKRVDLMINNGWIEECQNLLSKGVNLSNLKEIGYKEIGEYLSGNYSKEEIINVIKQKTRNYAKRQITWFKNKMDCINVNIDYDNINHTQEEIINLINEFLKKII